MSSMYLIGNKLLFNGKEQQEKTEWLGIGARMYMADIGRWGVVGPLADIMQMISPYTLYFKVTDNDYEYFDYLYWSFYSLIIKREGDERASGLFSVMMFFLLFLIFIWITIFLEWREVWSKNLNFAIVLPVLAVVNAILHSGYYVKNGRYREVDKYFNRIAQSP